MQPTCELPPFFMSVVPGTSCYLEPLKLLCHRKKVLKQEGSVYSWNVVDDMYFNLQFALSPNYLRIVCLKRLNQVCLELQKIYKCVTLYNIIMKVNK